MKIELTDLMNQNFPSPDKGVIETRVIGDNEIRIIKNGVPMGYNSVVALPWAALAIRNGEYCCAAIIEREDLRAISSFSGIPVKTLSEEYAVKGYLLDPKLVIYSGNEYEDIGVVNIEMDEESIKNFLVDTLLENMELDDEV